MGRACCEVTTTLLETLRFDPYCWQLKIVRAVDAGDGTWLVFVSSRLLRENCLGTQDLILGPQGIRFKSSQDT
jgi:hypothetical protein